MAALAPALFACTVNVPHSQILDNIKASKALGLQYVDICEPRERALAVVASGPSLRTTWQGIPPDCDIMALNGAYNFLLDNGRVPKYFATLDARADNVNFLRKPHPDVYHLLASQCHPDMFKAVEGLNRAVFHLDGEAHKTIYAPGDVTRMGAMPTIGLTALILSAVLGYRKLILYGYDSSFEDMPHVVHQPQNDGQKLVDVEFKGKWYHTTPAMAGQVSNFFTLHDLLQRNYPGIELHLRGSGLFYDFVIAGNSPTTREKELGKYAELYQHDSYGMTKFRYDQIVKAIPHSPYCRSIVDVGTGRGETIKIAATLGYEVIYGTETVDALLNENVYKAILPKLPFPDKSVDVATCFEVLEHLYPFDVIPSLKEMARIARRYLVVSVATTTHVVGGVNLHPSARSEEEWLETIRAALPDAKIECIGNASSLGASPIYRITL